MEKSGFRTRFAPSPTGYMHVGNLRTALYAYLTAKSSGGKFLLRIEDTDQERFVEGAIEIIYDTLRETGLIWDEGPDVGGPVGPYIQSQRMGMYAQYAKNLIDSGHAYYCFCDKDRLEDVRTLQKASGQPTRYDGFCRSLSNEEIAAKLGAKTPYVVRQIIPSEGITGFDDLVFGHIEVENSTLDDQVLLKADGMPTYNFANVVDDHTMGITHVIRGSEYLSSAPKYNLLYKSFGWEIPYYIHCPPVMKNATEKLSKRTGDASYQDLIAKGYLTGAILNYIALLGWSPGGEKEFFSLEELLEVFDVGGISKSPSIFDNLKLRHINAQWIRTLTPEKFHEMALPWIRKSVTRSDVSTQYLASLLQARCEVLEDIPDQLDFLDKLSEYSNDLYVSKKMKTDTENSLSSLKETLTVLEDISDWNTQNIHDALFALIEKLGVKNGLILWPLRIATSGKQFTPGGGVEIAYLIGKEDCLARIRVGIDKLGNK